MGNAICILNSGSSSLKFSLFGTGTQLDLLFRGELSRLLDRPHFEVHDAFGNLIDQRDWDHETQLGYPEVIEFALKWIAEEKRGGLRLVAAGHRVVHGGRRFVGPVRIDDAVLTALKELIPLAPLHQPHNVAAIESMRVHAPHLPQVACFDTAFHRSLPLVAQTFALPRSASAGGICRYGFHGISYEYIASRLPSLDPRAAAGRTVIAHLGNGASMCALLGGRSIATTMGLTPVDGLPMGTRCGSIDPGALLYLMRRDGLSTETLEKLIYERSGLLGVSEISSDMRTLLASDDRRAAEAVDLFVYCVGRELGSLAAALGGLDALVFTGGIGENSAEIRARVCRGAAWLGIELDESANRGRQPRISRLESAVAAWVLPTNEELMIAKQTTNLLSLPGNGIS
jgi:acetate kinase